MAKFQNTWGITRIVFGPTIRNRCPIGKDWYTNSLRVELIPGEFIPDYDDLQKDILALEGQELIVENVVAKVYDIVNAYDPKELTVQVKTEGNGHFSVVVEKTSQKA